MKDVDLLVSLLRRNPELVVAIVERNCHTRKRLHSHFRACGLKTKSCVQKKYGSGMRGLLCRCDECGKTTYIRRADIYGNYYESGDICYLRCRHCNQEFYYKESDSDEHLEDMARVYQNNTVLVGSQAFVTRYKKHPDSENVKTRPVISTYKLEFLQHFRVRQIRLDAHFERAPKAPFSSLGWILFRKWLLKQKEKMIKEPGSTTTSSSIARFPLAPIRTISMFLGVRWDC